MFRAIDIFILDLSWLTFPSHAHCSVTASNIRVPAKHWCPYDPRPIPSQGLGSWLIGGNVGQSS